MHDSETCAACRARVVPVRPRFAAKLAFAVALVALIGLCLAFPLFGFLWTFTAPPLVAVGLGLGPLADAAFAPAICPACDRRFVAEPGERPLRAESASTMLRA